MIKQDVRHTVMCPSCNQDTGSSVDHLQDYDIGFHTCWYCDNCGINYKLTKTGKYVLDWKLECLTEHKVNLAVYLKHGDMCIVHKGMTFKEIGDEIDWQAVWESKLFFYEEHNCPTNITHTPVIEISTGDKDPHGIFNLMAIELWDDYMDSDNYQWRIPNTRTPQQ